MEELFKSLSESVSEECFNDIMGIVEEVINEWDPDMLPHVARGMRKQVDKKGKVLGKELSALKKREREVAQYSEKAAGKALNDPEDDLKQTVAHNWYEKLYKVGQDVKNKKEEIKDNITQSNTLKRQTAEFKGRLR